MKNVTQQAFSVDSKSSSADVNEIDLFEILQTLWRGKILILFCTILAMIIGVYYAFFVAVPMYTTTAVVALESRQEQVVDIESVMTGLSSDQATINTEVEVFRSRGLITKLVNDLNLTSDPEFNATLVPERKYSIDKAVRWIKELVDGPQPDKPLRSEQKILDRTVDRLLNAVSISNVRQSYVFRVTVETTNPEKSAQIANRLAELYIDEQLVVKFAATDKATTWLADRVSQLQVELEDAEVKLKEFDTNTNLISPETLIALNRQLKELRDRSLAMSEQLVEERRTIAELEAAKLTGDPNQMAIIAQEHSLDLSALRVSSRQSAFNQLLERTKQSADRLEKQANSLNSSAKSVESQIEVQSTELVKLQQLQRETEASRLIYEYFLGRLKETSVQQGIQQADSRVISEAVVPENASSPKKPIVLATSMMLGMFIAAAILMGRELAQNTFRLAENLEAKTGYSVIGQIPMIPVRRRKKVLKYLTDRPNSAAAEAVRNLRTSLLLSDLDKKPQIIMSTSSVPSEGKTTTSLALTQNFAGMDSKVLLIEGDIRKRTFAKYFNLEDQKGLLSVLSGAATLDEAVIHEPSLKADLLVGEKSSTNAADLFSSTKFKNFLNSLRDKYDFIVIDTPPVLAVPDARVIGQSVDAIIYSVKWDHTTRRQVTEGLKSLESVNAKVNGLVLGQISPRGMKRYGYGDSYADYGSYYSN